MKNNHDRPDRRPAGRRAAPGRCPICGAATRRETRPFCSRRCADVDLGRWFGGAYRVPTDEAPGETPGQDTGDDEDHSNGRG